MDETATKADVESLRKDLRATGTRLGTKIDEVNQRLGAKIDEVDQRLSAKIGEVDERLDAKMDTGFAMVARQFVEFEDRLKRHTDMRFEQLREGMQKVADGVLGINERLDRHIQQLMRNTPGSTARSSPGTWRWTNA